MIRAILCSAAFDRAGAVFAGLVFAAALVVLFL